MSSISSEYAQALFMLAMENESGEEYSDALDLISDMLRENPEYIDFLSSYFVPLEERLDAVAKAFSDSVPGYVLSFVKLLCEKRHISEFFLCAEEYKALLAETKKISYAIVTSAVELNDKEKASLEEKLKKISGHTVVAEYTIDKTILGGLVVEMDGKIMDSSLQKHLKEVRDVIKQ